MRWLGHWRFMVERGGSVSLLQGAMEVRGR